MQSGSEVNDMTVRKSISFTEQHDEWVKAQVASGQYNSESEVIRELIRERVMREGAGDDWLRSEISRGLESGVSERSAEDVRRAEKESLAR